MNLQKYPDLVPSKPNEGAIEVAFKEALNYKPTFVKDMSGKTKGSNILWDFNQSFSSIG